MQFFNDKNRAKHTRYISSDPQDIALPASVASRNIVDNNTNPGNFTSGRPDTTISLISWINNRISEGKIDIASQIPSSDGNGIYSGSGTTPDSLVEVTNTAGLRFQSSSDSHMTIWNDSNNPLVNPYILNDSLTLGISFFDDEFSGNGFFLGIPYNNASPSIYASGFNFNSFDVSFVDPNYSYQRVKTVTNLDAPVPVNGRNLVLGYVFENADEGAYNSIGYYDNVAFGTSSNFMVQGRFEVFNSEADSVRLSVSPDVDGYFTDNRNEKIGFEYRGFGENGDGNGGNYTDLQNNSLAPKALTISSLEDDNTNLTFTIGDNSNFSLLSPASGEDLLRVSENRVSIWSEGEVNISAFDQNNTIEMIDDALTIFADGARLDLTSPSTGALKYAGDYSANFTDRSLVDKAYVDNNAGGDSIYTANGTLTGNRIVTANDHNLFIVDPKIFAVSRTDMGLEMGNAGTTFFDYRTTPVGIQYGADYSSTFIDRSLVDKAFATPQLISGGEDPTDGLMPRYIGDLCINTTTGTVYIATALNTDEWRIVNATL
jgi:hypothetical protein